MEEYGSYIDGDWKVEGQTFSDMSPVSGVEFAAVVDASEDDARAAIEAAHNAFPEWAALTPKERGAYLIKVAEAVEDFAGEFEDILIDEIGSWIGKAKFELKSCAQFFRTAAKLGEQVKGYEIPSEQGKKSIVIREPLGVVSVITPWNVPLNLSSRTTSGILAVGNTVVLKPSEESPLSGGYILAKAFEKAECMASVDVGTSYSDAEEYLEESIADAYGNADSYRGVEITTSMKEVYKALNYQLKYCGNTRNAAFAQARLADIATSFEVYGGVRELHDTGDDDTTDSYIIVMKDGTYLNVYFSN